MSNWISQNKWFCRRIWLCVRSLNLLAESSLFSFRTDAYGQPFVDPFAQVTAQQAPQPIAQPYPPQPGYYEDPYAQGMFIKLQIMQCLIIYIITLFLLFYIYSLYILYI